MRAPENPDESRTDQILLIVTKEKVMQAVLKRFILIGVASLFLSPIAAFSQDEDENEDENAPPPTREQMWGEEHDKLCEQYAPGAFRNEIKAGKMTQEQAIAYFKCANKDYAFSLRDSPEAQGYAGAMFAAKVGSKEFIAAQKGIEKFQNQAEERCMKKLGMKVTRGKAFGRD